MRSMSAVLVLLLGALTVKHSSVQDMEKEGGGMQVEQFRAFANSLPKLSGNIQSLRLFESAASRQSVSVAIATFDNQNGWNIWVFEPDVDHKYQLSWQSGKLDNAFSVSSPEALKVFHLRDEDAIVFDGCAPHACPDVFSILLYVPSQRASYSAKYVKGNVTYTSTVTSGDKGRYKSTLDQLIKEHIN